MTWAFSPSCSTVFGFSCALAAARLAAKSSASPGRSWGGENLWKNRGTSERNEMFNHRKRWLKLELRWTQWMVLIWTSLQWFWDIWMMMNDARLLPSEIFDASLRFHVENQGPTDAAPPRWYGPGRSFLGPWSSSSESSPSLGWLGKIHRKSHRKP